jgi:trk system potassium uptake protein
VKQAAVPPRAFLLLFFVGLIGVGSFLLLLPVSWQGRIPLRVIDAVFIATSAVCVTGLTSVDLADFTRFGQTVVLLLIQTGGLGIITFSTLLLMLPGRRKMSFRARHFVQSYSIPVVEHDPARMTFYIVTFTLGIEIAGAVLLYPWFKARVHNPVFMSVFHAVSAFCNAGFSPIRTSLEEYRTSPYLLLVVGGLIVCGGIGFVVVVDVVKRLAGWKRALTFHSRIVLWTTAVLIVAGALAFYVMEAGHTMADLSLGHRVVNALFQSITPRTAGYSSLPQGGLSLPSQMLTMLLMFVGGSSGSTAGGIKTSTACLVMLQLMAQRDPDGQIVALRRKIDAGTLADALLFSVRAIGLLFMAVFVLLLFEIGSGKSFISLAFESFSAFGTVGLSMGVTPTLSFGGKLVLIATMFTGRVGLVSLAGRDHRPRAKRLVDYPQGEVLTG